MTEDVSFSSLFQDIGNANGPHNVRIFFLNVKIFKIEQNENCVARFVFEFFFSVDHM